MTVAQCDRIEREMQQKTTDELLEIWGVNDREQWSDSAFNAISQALSERGVSIPPQRTFAPSPPRYRGVRGWLLFFCVGLTVLSPLRIMGKYGADGIDIWSIRGVTIDGLLSLAFACFSIYVGVCLWRVRPGAVKKAIVFLWFVVAFDAIVALLAYMGGSKPSADGRTVEESLAQCMSGAIAALVWLAYLRSSKRVRATYDL
jgi:hypothetical protein